MTTFALGFLVGVGVTYVWSRLHRPRWLARP